MSNVFSSLPLSAIPAEKCCPELAAGHVPRFFKALADPNRVALLGRLAQAGRACTVGEIACCLPIDLSVVSRHLAMLRDAGILHAEKRGKEVYYEVRYDELVRTLRRIADAIECCCPQNVKTSKLERKSPDVQTSERPKSE